MALENIAEIEKAFGLEEGKFNEMFSSEEKHSIDLSLLLIEPKSIYEERIANIKTNSATMAKEVSIKEIKKALGLEFEGKNETVLIEALKSKFETIKTEVIKDPEQRFTTLKADFDKLQGNLIAKETEFETFKTNIENQSTLNEIKNDFTKHIPDNVLVSKSTIFTEAKEKGFSFEKENGKTVVKQNGEVLKDDKTLSPIGIDSWVKEFVIPYLKTVEGGSGKKDENTQGKAGSFEAFQKEAEKNDWDATKFNAEMSKRIKEGSLSM
jgi:23S rRNA U2552 (ribose-2'-O)-methylase RlmE/FtsJ